MSKLFISHASADRPLVDAFVDLLERGVGVHPDQIFCTSFKGQGVRQGTYFAQEIREALGDAVCVIALMSPNFYASPSCMCELGGAWIQAKEFHPLLVPPLRFDSLEGLLAGLQAAKLDERKDLDELRDDIVRVLRIKGRGTPRWNETRGAFISKLPDILRTINSTSPRERRNDVVKSVPSRKTIAKGETEVAKPERRGVTPKTPVWGVANTRRQANARFERELKSLYDRPEFNFRQYPHWDVIIRPYGEAGIPSLREGWEIINSCEVDLGRGFPKLDSSNTLNGDSWIESWTGESAWRCFLSGQLVSSFLFQDDQYGKKWDVDESDDDDIGFLVNSTRHNTLAYISLEDILLNTSEIMHFLKAYAPRVGAEASSVGIQLKGVSHVRLETNRRFDSNEPSSFVCGDINISYEGIVQTAGLGKQHFDIARRITDHLCQRFNYFDVSLDEMREHQESFRSKK